MSAFDEATPFIATAKANMNSTTEGGQEGNTVTVQTGTEDTSSEMESTNNEGDKIM